MAKMLKILSRHKINSLAWDACVAASSQRILYGYSWYLDAVLPEPFWKWVGVVLTDETGQYQAVMPIPLRQKRILGITYSWVVHQPFFCQVLGVFSRNNALDATPFFRAMQQKFRYGSTVNVRQQPDQLGLSGTIRPTTTHILDLSADYKTIYQNYTQDRKKNLRQARRGFEINDNWVVEESTEIGPLLVLFRENHADTIEGGVADWAYLIFRKLVDELSQRGLVTLRYAIRDGRIEAGALFVREGNRIIYLFNAASEIGRRGNARTLLIDRVIQKFAGDCDEGGPLLFDFESPEKSAIRHFYQSFGATEESFWEMRWNRLNPVENKLRSLRKAMQIRDAQ